MQIHLSMKSSNSKTGPIPVSTTSADTCPKTCPLKSGGGCYAEANIHLRRHWNKVSAGARGSSWEKFCEAIATLPTDQLWRHNQAGDLPGIGDDIDSAMLGQLATANMGRRGFTYTHKPLSPSNAAAIKDANARGFTVNLSANNLGHADILAESGAGPVVAILPAKIAGNVKIETPAGRRVVVCPATYRDDVTCASCGLCQRVDRKVVVGFPAHGTAKSAADFVAKGA